MTKAELVEKVASQINLTKKQTEVVVNTVFQSITESLSEGKKVELRGFGSFIVKHRAARDARNPATRDIVKLQERHIPAFKVSKILKEIVNKSLLRGF